MQNSATNLQKGNQISLYDGYQSHESGSRVGSRHETLCMSDTCHIMNNEITLRMKILKSALPWPIHSDLVEKHDIFNDI